ncbi:unnamed protein product, partial [Meganyctiphanes norvegica]
MALKTAGTIYCFGFDPSLISAYSQNNIEEILTTANWKIRGVYIMNSKRSFKIEFQTTTEAKRFIVSKNTSIGGIQLHPESKEPEVDPSCPTISQCWHCGRLNPNHSSSDCKHTKRCLKCNSCNHQFFTCNIPKDHSILTYDQKEK